MKILQKLVISPPVFRSLAPKDDILSISMVATSKSVLSYFDSKPMDCRNQLDNGQIGLHEPSVSTVQSSGNGSLSYRSSCLYVLNCRKIEVSFLLTTLPFKGILNLSDATGILPQWRLQLSEYYFDGFQLP